VELTRRDAAAALASAGIAVGGGAAVLDPVPPREDARGAAADARASNTLDALVAVARIVYPTPVESVASFVRTVTRRRFDARPDHAAGVREAVGQLDAHAAAWYDAAFLDLGRDGRERLLEDLGVDAAHPDPEGTPAERVRYYVVNDLLFALYTTPTGGRLVGIENPQGHPGGTDSYRRPPAR
jgi:hypothetical protein